MAFSLYKKRVYKSDGVFTGTAGQNLQNSFSNLADELANHWFDVKQYGALGDGATVFDAAITNGQATLTSATAGFTAGDVGKVAYVAGAGAAGADLKTTISGFTNSTTVTLAATAGTTVTNAIFAWQTNDRAAIQNAINDACTTSGGVVYFPPGIYGIEGLQDTGTFNSILEIPFTGLSQAQRSVTLQGAPSFDSNWPISSQKPNQGGSILRSLTTAYNSGVPAMLASNQYNATTSGLYGTDNGFSFTGLSIFDLKFRQPNNPQLTCIQHAKGGPFRLDRVSCDVECITANIASPSSTYSATGLFAPNNLNAAIVDVGTFDALGYYTGVIFEEHFTARRINVFCCNEGMRFGGTNGGHGNWVGRYLAQWCVKHLIARPGATGPCDLVIDCFDTEQGPLSGGPAWAVTTYDISDESNVLYGAVHGRAWLSGVGTATFKMNRAANIDVWDNSLRKAGQGPSGSNNYFASHRYDTVLAGGPLTYVGVDDATYQNPGANADSFSFDATLAAGTYTVTIKGFTQSTSGKLDCYIDNVLITTIDWYSASSVDTTKTFSTGALSGGRHTFKFIVNGKNASSTGFVIYLHSFTIA